jgi:hypothetical protein
VRLILQIFPCLNIKELRERLKWRLHNTQQDLKEEKEDTTALKTTISQLKVTWKSWNLNLVIKETSSKPRMSRLPIY